MKVALNRKLPFVIGLFFAVWPASVLAAPTKPYFKAFGGDVMTGVWYSAATTCDTSPASNYQDPSYSNVGAGIGADNRNGGILSYAKESGSGNSAGGSSSQFAAFAAGLIEGSDAQQYGFYSDGAQAANPTPKNALSFANTASGAPWGGYYEGSVRQSNCIPDYYAKKPTNPTPTPLVAPLPANPATGAYSASSAVNSTFTLTNTNVTIPRGVKVTVYVSGNVFINNNIVYDLNTVNDVPKFALVVKGNIYIGAGVTQLDGAYIAQPSTNSSTTVASDDGDIWTCHDNNTNAVLYSYPAFVTSCSANKLVVNGALIAKQVNFLRLKGDVAGASTNEDTLSNALSSSNIAEVINYTPEMVIGGPFFNQPKPTGLPIDSIISLPPVF